MRRYLVRRVAVGCTAVFLAAAALFAWMEGRRGTAGGAVDPAAVFAARCGACHEAGDLRRDLARAADAEAARRDLLALLASHGDATVAERAALVEFLMPVGR